MRSRSQDGTTRYAAVQSCHGSGKSFSNLRVVAQCPPSGRGVHLTAAPTCKQIHAVLWREMGRAPPCSRSARLHQAGRRAEYRGPSSSASGASPPMRKIRSACNRRFTRRRSKQSLLNLRNGTNTDYLKPQTSTVSLGATQVAAWCRRSRALGRACRVDCCAGPDAKPVIDIVLVVSDSADEAGYVPNLEAAGYVLHVREPSGTSTGCSKVTLGRPRARVSTENPEVERMLLFRDRLRTRRVERDMY